MAMNPPHERTSNMLPPTWVFFSRKYSSYWVSKRGNDDTFAETPASFSTLTILQQRWKDASVMQPTTKTSVLDDVITAGHGVKKR